MTDIVERLRELADGANAHPIGELWNGLDEAADEIDQLRARIAEMELKLKGEFAAGKSVFEEKERLQQRVWELEAQRVPGRIALLSDVPMHVQDESMGSTRASYRAGWNDCREALLAAAQPEQEQG